MYKLKIKYGLSGNEPTKEQVQHWARRVKELVDLGSDLEDAGEQAAGEIFRTYRTAKYASQADTIYDLLKELSGD